VPRTREGSSAQRRCPEEPYRHFDPRVDESAERLLLTVTMDIALGPPPRDRHHRQDSSLASSHWEHVPHACRGNPQIALYMIHIHRRVQQDRALRPTKSGDHERRTDRRRRVRPRLQLLRTTFSRVRDDCRHTYERTRDAREPTSRVMTISYRAPDTRPARRCRF
jgi:hypothetical protein